MADSIECGGAERQNGTVGDGDPAGAEQAIGDSALGRDPQARDWQVGECDTATARLCQVERWPARAGAIASERLISGSASA